MKHNTVFYQLSTLTMNPCSPDREWDREARQTWQCPDCMSVKRPFRAIDGYIQDKRPADPPLNFIQPTLGVARRDFLDEMSAEIIERELYLGKLFGNHGEKLIEEWVTFCGKNPIIVRGSKEAGFRRCDDCGRIVYFAMGKKYLYPTPAEGPSIFDSGRGRLVVRQEILARLDRKKWPKLRVEKLFVPEEPLDGLGILEDA